MTTKEELIADYKAKAEGWNDFQKAVQERKIWEALTPDDRKIAVRRAEVLAKLLGGPPTGERFEQRNRLLNAGSKAELLWPELAKGLSYNIAMQCLAKIKQLVFDEKIDDTTAAKRVLDELKSLPTAHTPTGRITYRRSQHNIRQAPGVQRVRKTKPDSERALWDAARDALHNLASAKLATLPDSPEKAMIIKDLEIDIKTLFSDWSSKFNRLKKARKDFVTTLARPKVRAACITLHLDSPPVGKPVDLKAAASNKKKLVSQFHPDKHGGDEKMRDLFESVLDAYSTLERYNQQFTQP